MNGKPSVGFVTVPLRVLTDREVSASAKLLYGLIDYYQMMSGGICYETNESLASWMDCDQQSITRLVRQLRKAGYIECTYDRDNYRMIRILE